MKTLYQERKIFDGLPQKPFADVMLIKFTDEEQGQLRHVGKYMMVKAMYWPAVGTIERYECNSIELADDKTDSEAIRHAISVYDDIKMRVELVATMLAPPKEILP